MSQETQAWAKQQRTGDPVTKAVLSELCNWAKPNGSVEFLSLAMIADAIEVSKRTVMRHLDRLEHSLGLIVRIERHRPDGGKSANGFWLVGYEPEQWSRAKAPAPRSTARPVPASSVATPGDRMAQPPGDKVARGQCQIVTEPGDTCVTPLGDKINPPIPADAGMPPAPDLAEAELTEQGEEQGGPQPGQEDEPHGGQPASDPIAAPRPARDPRGSRLPDDWTPPDPADLGPVAANMVRTWPNGAYAAVAETFRMHWHSQPGQRGRKLDWVATLGKWIITEHSRVMRDAKAGVSFAPPPSEPAGSGALYPNPPAARRNEDERSQAIRRVLQSKLAPGAYDRWIERLAIIVEPHGGVRITARGEGMMARVRKERGGDVEDAARTVLTRAFAGLNWTAEPVNAPARPAPAPSPASPTSPPKETR